MKEKLCPISFEQIWTIFEQQVPNMYTSQKLQVFSSFCRPETQFKHAQGHQRAVASTNPINNIQNTNITVHELEHQKTINMKKHGYGPIVFQKWPKNAFITTFRRATLRNAKIQEVKLHYIATTHYSILQNPMAKNYGLNQKRSE